MPQPPGSAGIIEHYQANKYAPRGPAVYVASLYRDPPFDADTDACACGHSDPLHVRDACAGLMHVDGEAAMQMRDRRVFGAELNALSCDVGKAQAVSDPLAWQHEVDALTSPSGRRTPPPRGLNVSHGQGAHLAFEEWAAAKAQRALQQEARRKRQALAELCTQVARQAQAQEAFQQWSAEKAAAAAAAPQAPALSPAEQAAHDAELEARRTALFGLWRASKDAQRVESQRAASARSQSDAAADALRRDQAAFRASQAYQSWKRALDEREAAIRSDRRRSDKQRAEDLEATKRTRATRGAEMFAQWLRDKEAARLQRAKEQSEKQSRAEEQAAKHAAEVERTRVAREQRLAAHLHSLQRERHAEESAAHRQQRQSHRTAWAKKEIGPVAYSTLTPTKRAFR